MVGQQVNQFSRTFSPGMSRRGVLAGLAGLLGESMPVPAVTEARKRKRKIKRNEFDCVNVGNYCKHADDCCSGNCTGKKGKEKCRAHDIGDCEPGQVGSPCTTSAEHAGTCEITTGNALYCAFGTFGNVQAPFCARDPDCQAKEQGDPRSACISDGHFCANP